MMPRDSSTKRPRKTVQRKLTDILSTSKRDDSRPFKKVKTRVEKSVDSSATDNIVIDSGKNEAESSTSVAQGRKLNYEKNKQKKIDKRNRADKLLSDESGEENKVDEFIDEVESEPESEGLGNGESEDELKVRELPEGEEVEEAIESAERGARSILSKLYTYYSFICTPFMLFIFNLIY